jgi:kynurenine formamidase
MSHVIAPGMPEWPGDPPLQFETVADRAVDGYYLRRLAIGEHSATHVNAPLSFHADGVGIDSYAAASLIAPAVVLDVRAGAQADADYLASPTDLAAWEDAHGPVPAGSVVLLHTGWAQRWGDRAAFLNADDDGRLHFPGFGLTLVDILLEQRGVAGIGIDTHGVDGGLDQRFTVNARVLQRARLVVETLANLDELPPVGATLVIGVLRLRDGSGSPAAVMAFVP